MDTRSLLHLVIAFFLTFVTTTHAQTQRPQIGVAVPPIASDEFPDSYFDEFEAEHNVEVYIKTIDFGELVDENGSYIPLDVTEKYIQLADVLLVNTEQRSSAPLIDLQQTLAGYYLDIAPLVSADTTINPSDYIDQVWQAFQWSGKMWAIPAYVDIEALMFDPSFFNEHQLLIPPPNLDINGWITLLEEASKYTDKQPLYNNAALESLILSSANTDLISTDLDSLEFLLDREWLIDQLEVWSQADIIQDTMRIPNGASMSDFPLIYNTLDSYLIERRGYQAWPPPGGKPKIDVGGFAISRLTQHPELAYELAKYMANQPEITNVGLLPANQQASQTLSQYSLPLSQETQGLFESLVRMSKSPAQNQLSGFLYYALTYLGRHHISPADAAYQMEEDINEAIVLGMERNTDFDRLTIHAPTPLILAEGEAILQFGIDSPTAFLDHPALEPIIETFVSTQPSVGHVHMKAPHAELGQPQNADWLADQFDCFYTSQKLAHPSGLDALTNLTPLLTADAGWDQNTIPQAIINQVQYDGQMWAVPVSIHPVVSFIHPDMGPFTSPLTVSQLIAELPASSGSQTMQPLYPGSSDYLLTLIAAYGGLPIDYRTTPLTIDFTSPEVEEAIQTVINLIHTGHLGYYGLSEEKNIAPDYTADVYFAPYEAGNMLNGYSPTNPPVGADGGLITLDVGAVYISHQTPHIEPCYAFIQHLLQSEITQIFGGIPTNALRAVLDDPGTIIRPTRDTYEGYSSWLIDIWLQQLFESAITNPNHDLTVELQGIQTKVETFTACNNDILHLADDLALYFEKYMDCVVQADPTLQDLMTSLPG